MFSQKYIGDASGSHIVTIKQPPPTTRKEPILTKLLQKPWRGGRKYALWSAVWAFNQDVQMAIEEHNASLERGPWSETDFPPPVIPNEKHLSKASLTEDTEEELW